MKINEKDQQIKKCENGFGLMLKIFFGETSLWKVSINQKMFLKQFLGMFETFFWWDPFLLKEYTFLARVLKALWGNKMEFSIFEKKSIIQKLQNCAPIY